MKPDKHIWLISSEGRETRRLVEGDPRSDLHWTPDSQWVFYRDRQFFHLYRGTRRVRFVRIADGHRVDIDLPEEVASAGRFLSWTQDGQQMLFYRPRYEWTIGLRLMPTAGGETREPLGELIYSGVQQYWSPDGRYVVTSDWQRYWIVPISGQKPYPLDIDVRMDGRVMPESISPNGDRLLFAVQDDIEQNHFVVPISLEEGKTIGAPMKVFDKKIKWSGEMGWVPQIKWSPNGSRLALISGDDLWIVSADGADSRQLASDPDSYAYRPEWFADSTTITWTSYSRSANSSTPYICRPPGGEPTTWTEHFGAPGFVFLQLENGKTGLYYFEGGGLWAVTWPEGDRRRLLDLEPGRRVDCLTVSPDETTLAYLLDDRVFLLSVRDGQIREIENAPASSWARLRYFRWSLDGQTLGFSLRAPRGSDKPHRYFVAQVSGGKWTERTTDVTEGTSPRYLLDLSPDGRWSSYSEESVREWPEGIVWAVEMPALPDQSSNKSVVNATPAERYTPYAAISRGVLFGLFGFPAVRRVG